MSDGKLFERNFKESAERRRVDITRLYDPVGGRKGVANICDFIAYEYPRIYYFELKSRKGKSFNLGGVTENQFNGLREKAKTPGTVPGIIIKFNEIENAAYFIHINEIERLRQYGEKSINVDKAAEIGVKLYGTVKRVNYDYDVGLFLDDLAGRF